MSYLRNLKQLRETMVSQATKASAPEESPDSLIAARYTDAAIDNRSAEDLVSQSASWLSDIKNSAAQSQANAPRKSGNLATGLVKALATGVKAYNNIGKEDAEAEERKAAFIEKRSTERPSTYAPDKPEQGSADPGRKGRGESSDGKAPGYGDISKKTIENIVRAEASLRNMDPDVAVAIFRSEGAGNYQSQVARKGKGSYDGKEDSYGPYQLYRGGGLGNKYESATGRNLREDNTIEGITNQVRFSLDAAVSDGWAPWYGRKTAGVGVRDGLSGAKKVGNWK